MTKLFCCQLVDYSAYQNCHVLYNENQLAQMFRCNQIKAAKELFALWIRFLPCQSLTCISLCKLYCYSIMINVLNYKKLKTYESWNFMVSNDCAISEWNLFDWKSCVLLDLIVYWYISEICFIFGKPYMTTFIIKYILCLACLFGIKYTLAFNITVLTSHLW